MSDNTTITPGTGATVAADNISGALHQRIKLTWGVDGAAVDASATNPLPVTAALAAGTNNIGDVDVLTLPALPAGTNAIGKLAANSGVDIGDVDITSILPGTGATNLGKIEDAAHTTGDVGVMALGVRNDAGTTLATTTGDYIPLSMDANGALRVSGAGGGTQYVEDVAHASGDTGTMLLAVRNDAGTALAGTTGDYIPITTDANGYLYVNMGAGTLNLGAGETHLGEVGGNTAIISPSITVTAGAYSANDVIGGEITLTSAARISGGSGVITDIIILDDDNEKAVLTILLYDSDPAANTADNGAFAWGSGDLARCIGKVNVAAADYETAGGNAVAHKQNLGIAFKANGSANLFMYIIGTGGPTYTATTDLQVKVKVLRD